MLKMNRKDYIDVIVANSNGLSTYEQWAERLKKTTWFSAERALEWGLVDEIQ
jgi:ATP-dependent protease ClpP protease subunit